MGSFAFQNRIAAHNTSNRAGDSRVRLTAENNARRGSAHLRTTKAKAFLDETIGGSGSRGLYTGEMEQMRLIFAPYAESERW